MNTFRQRIASLHPGFAGARQFGLRPSGRPLRFRHPIVGPRLGSCLNWQTRLGDGSLEWVRFHRLRTSAECPRELPPYAARPIAFMKSTHHCPNCNQAWTVSDHPEGPIRCPHCGAENRVTDMPPTPPVPPKPADNASLAQFQVFDRPEELTHSPTVRPQPTTAGHRLDPGKLAVSRSVIYLQGILLAVVAFVFFVLGLMVGTQSRPTQSPQTLRQVPCVLTGQVTFRQGSERLPDHGSLIFVLPAEEVPELKARAEDFPLGDVAPDPSSTSAQTLQELGGGYARANAQGRFRIRLPASGSYFVLCVSRNLRRTAGEDPGKRDLAQMGRYFLPPTDLIGDQTYRWSVFRLSGDQILDMHLP